MNLISCVIESVSNLATGLADSGPTKYAVHMLRTLDNPDETHKTVIEDRISHVAKEMIYVLWTSASEC